jgi:hypothetical protein
MKFYDFKKSQKPGISVIPAKARIQFVIRDLNVDAYC